MSTAIAQFLTETRAILAAGVSTDTLSQVGALLGAAASRSDFLPSAQLRSLHGGGSVATLLQTDPDGLTLVLAQFAPREETPVHDHGSWGVACVVRGRGRYRHWERQDDGAEAERAQLRMRYEAELGPGEFVTWLDPPDDIHSQMGLGGPAVEIVLFGRNVLEGQRHHFDPESGSVRTALLP